MTKTTSPIAFVLLFVLTTGAGLRAAPTGGASGKTTAAPVPQQPRIQVLFSPDGGCTEAIVAAVCSAKRTIDVQAYSFTSASIAKAVAEAHERGVKVRIVLDKSQRTERYTSATFLHNHQVPVWIDAEHAIAHNKIILIDGGARILTGSFNFTKSAEERNAENLLIIEGQPELAAKYAANFEAHLKHAEPYEGLKKQDDGAAATGEDATEQEKPTAAGTPVAPRKPAAKRSRKAA
jgi:phosphatidylserine/phosphatidylglycerophosphate/cardiolipin synthase-like enzyme